MAWHLNIWSDEASTLYTTQNGIFEAFSNAGDEKQAPLYFVLLGAWRLIDDSHFFARLFSVLCSVLSIAAFFNVPGLLAGSQTYDNKHEFWKQTYRCP